MAQRDSAGQLIYLHSDHLGSTSLVTDSNGTRISQKEYDPWGRIQASVGASGQTDINYTGQKLDDTGLLYYHARYYDSALGKFVSPDTMIQAGPQGLNRYSYAGNNPI